MARRGSIQKNGLDRSTSNHKKGGLQSGSAVPNRKGKGNVSDTKVVKDELSGDNEPGISNTEALHSSNNVRDEDKRKSRSGKPSKAQMPGKSGIPGPEQPDLSYINVGDCSSNMPTTESSSTEEKWASANGFSRSKNRKSGHGRSMDGFDKDGLHESVELPDNFGVRYLKAFAFSASKASMEWLERHKPFINAVIAKILISRDYVRMKIEHTYPIVLRWLTHFANILLLLSMIWLDCALRGIDSVLRMGTTSFFTVIWCSIFSVIAMIGMLKFFAFGVVVALVGFFVGLTIAFLLLAVSGVVFLWLYGSFWTTLLVLLFGGLAFTFSHERIALLITTVYSVYCAWTLVGWFGLLVALNFSFFSCDAMVFFLRNNINVQRRASGAPEQTGGIPSGSGVFTGEQMHTSSSDTGTNPSAERSPGIPSTSGSDSDLTSEDEVLRLLNSTDHYSALGLSRFQEIDASFLKREYRKKAMLVHPDKNMGNEKAAEAFKKLQNAYEVLLDTSKQKAYDDELRREDLLNYFRRFQNAPKNKRHGFFGSTFGRTEVEVEDPLGESRRIACRKCGGFHMWFYTKKTKSKARWCQDCKDFHPVKDGDGWVEQSSQPLLFGIFQKVEAPCAYVCADSKIYDATEWYICQGMRCPANAHKTSFHVNTNITSKHGYGKGPSSGQRGGAGVPPNMEETMTEEEFMEWLQNAVQSGMFDQFPGNASDVPSSWTGNSSKSGSASNNGSKRKKKGKKW